MKVHIYIFTRMMSVIVSCHICWLHSLDPRGNMANISSNFYCPYFIYSTVHLALHPSRPRTHDPLHLVESGKGNDEVVPAVERARHKQHRLLVAIADDVDVLVGIAEPHRAA